MSMSYRCQCRRGKDCGSLWHPTVHCSLCQIPVSFFISFKFITVPCVVCPVIKIIYFICHYEAYYCTCCKTESPTDHIQCQHHQTSLKACFIYCPFVNLVSLIPIPPYLSLIQITNAKKQNRIKTMDTNIKSSLVIPSHLNPFRTAVFL